MSAGRRNVSRKSVITALQRTLINPISRRVPRAHLIETVGRKSGEPRTTPVSGRLDGDEYWFVSEYGPASQYVKNIQANPEVRIRVKNVWRSGRAVLRPDDDPRRRLRTISRNASVVVRAVGDDLLSIQVVLRSTS